MYTPRSGALRKVKYALPIYHADEDEFVEHKLEMSKALEEEKILNPNQNVKQSVENLKSLPKAEFTCIPEDEYDNLYPKVKSKSKPRKKTKAPSFPLPSFTFPVTTCEDNPFSETSDPNSDYDLDSEDELWLKEHPETNITPSRLEHIFTRLNSRDTHVRRIAIGSLRPIYHDDFSVIFPYWKEKRQNRNNISTWKTKTKCFNEKEKKGYIGQPDPYVIFSAKLQKPKPKVNPLKKCGSKEETKTVVNKIISLTAQLKQLRSWADDMVLKGEHNRNQLIRNFNSFMPNSGDHSLTTPPSADILATSTSDEKICVTNNPSSTKPFRELTQSASFDMSYRITSDVDKPLPAKAHCFSEGLISPKIDLKFEDVLSGKWAKTKDENETKPSQENLHRQSKRKHDDL